MVERDPQPGIVLFEFRDASGDVVTMVAKDIWTDEDIPQSGEPVEAWVPVTLISAGSGDESQFLVQLPDGDEQSLRVSVGDLRLPT
jgi:hypothetical protein